MTDYTIWYEIFLTLNLWVNHLSDLQTDCATHNQCMSEVHDTVWIKVNTCLETTGIEIYMYIAKCWLKTSMELSNEFPEGIFKEIFN